jgi:arabinofuranosyltransferase
VLVLHRAWVCDDIYITFRYCDNVLAGHGPVYNPGERSEGYTHFLWFVLLTIGRAFGIPADLLGKYAGVPAYLGCLFLLARISGRLFPGRGGWAGLPVAMLGWALHPDARLFASGGLETPLFTLFLLLGFYWTCVSARPRHGALAGWALALAWLLRPDGLLYALLAAAFLFWRGERRALRDYATVWLVLAVPHFVFRMLYYGHPLPNPYYAKSGGAANWQQGWLYAWLYFGAYVVLLGALAAPFAFVRGLRRGPRAGQAATAPAALAFAWIAATLTIFYVIRVGGDFMFARFFLPVTPLLLLGVESLVHLLPRWGLRVAATAVVAALVVWGGLRKQAWLQGKRSISGVVDEPQYYPEDRMRDVRARARTLGECLAGTHATLIVQGGQASLAYYARYPVAIERYGLTDPTIAHGAIRTRGRPGHEKYATASYIYARGVNLRFNYRPVRNVPMYTLLELGEMSGEIIIYDRALMEHLKTCRGARFLDFPLWLANEYLPQVPQALPQHLRRDWNHFHLFYFDHNADPEHLRDRLRAALAARGITNLPEHGSPTGTFDDAGAPTAP